MQTSPNQWIPFKDPIEHFKASFPFEPVHMQFNLTAEDALQGTLNVYSVSWDKGVAMITTLASSLLKSSVSEEEFKQIFYSCFARRMFYQPRVFKNNASFQVKKTTIENHPALDFSISFVEGGEEQVLKGFAIVQDQILYMVFSISNKEEAKSKEFDTFLHSFHLTH